MDCCSSSCSSSCSSAGTPNDNPQIRQTAERLAVLLKQTEEYQEFVRLASLVNLDPDVRRILLELRQQQMMYANPTRDTIESLQAELETLPAVQAYRAAEAAVKTLFHSVDRAIGAAAGVEFAPNALRSGCG
ncbi:MAG TPA: YlbF family regulator [Anaerolineaceae bacterium]|nr:YlbF family regulator [Anaerolineaceae bacterium]